MGLGDTALGVITCNCSYLHALLWSYKVISSPLLTCSLACSSWKYLLCKTISAAPALGTGTVIRYPRGRAVRKEGGGKGLAQDLWPCSSLCLCQSPGNQGDCYWCCWRRGWGVVMNRGTALASSRSCSAQLSCPMGRCSNLSSPFRLLPIVFLTLTVAQATLFSLGLVFVPDPWGNSIRFCM